MGEDVESHLNRIQKEADRLNALVGELLQVTRAEGDASTFGRNVSLSDELVAEVVEDGRLEAEARGCGIALEAQPVSIAGDPELLRRALENVVRNGIRYAPTGTDLEVRLSRRDRHACIEVRDHGPGVPEESLPRIFDAFYRVETDRVAPVEGWDLALRLPGGQSNCTTGVLALATHIRAWPSKSIYR